MAGSAFVRRLEARSDVTEVITRARSQLDLLDQAAVRRFFDEARPDTVILAAARVGGIYANNTMPADFIYENLMVECNVLHQAFEAGVERLLFLGSSCIYPRLAPQPMPNHQGITVFRPID